MRVLRWADIVVLSGIVVAVLSAFVVAGHTTAVDLVNALGISLIVFGLIYLLVGLFDETITRVQTHVREKHR